MSRKQKILTRLWIYQAERFPIFKHGFIIASFSFCAICLSSLLRHNYNYPNLSISLTCFICLFLFFLQLRILDEFKDYEEDLKYRPDRAVSRGLITLKELKILLILCIICQLILSAFLNWKLILIQFAIYTYMALMTVEFFAKEWLKNRIFTYMWTHMLIMPLIDFYATACDWINANNIPPNGIIWFLIISFFNGCILELGRKTWAKEQEIEGVNSYSSAWGLNKALYCWLSAVVTSAILGIITASYIRFTIPALITFILFLFAAINIVFGFIKNPSKKYSNVLENFSGIWVAMTYFTLGVIPMIYCNSRGFQCITF